MGKRLYVGNLPYDADEASLRDAFSQDGRIVERVHIVIDRETQRPRGFAFVEMATDEQAKLAIETLDGSMFGTRQLRVTEAEERRPAGAGGPGGGPGGPRPGGPGGPPRQDRGPGTSSGPRFGSGSGPARTDGNRFGPDARPKNERRPERKPPPRRREEPSDDAFGGRRGFSRFDDDEE